MHLLCSILYVMHLLRLDYTLPQIVRHFLLHLYSMASFKDILVCSNLFGCEHFSMCVTLCCQWLFLYLTHQWTFYPVSDYMYTSCTHQYKLSSLALDTASVSSITAIIFDILIFMVCPMTICLPVYHLMKGSTLEIYPVWMKKERGKKSIPFKILWLWSKTVSVILLITRWNLNILVSTVIHTKYWCSAVSKAGH